MVNKTLSQIEYHIGDYLDGNIDGLETCLRVAMHALEAAAHLHGGADLIEAHRLVAQHAFDAQGKRLEAIIARQGGDR